MYNFYSMTKDGPHVQYKKLREAHIFGCNVGLIASLLKKRLLPTDSQPLRWHLSVENILAEQLEALIIDLKPNNADKGTSRSLYMVKDVWGFSHCDWTPALMRMRGLVVDGDPVIENQDDFTVEINPGHENIYTILYFDGTIKNGHLDGRWVPPSRSSTNSALLWPDTVRYFFQIIKEVTPSILESL